MGLFALVQGPSILHLRLAEQGSLIFLHQEKQVALYLEDASAKVALQHVLDSFEFHLMHVEEESILGMCHLCLDLCLLVCDCFGYLCDE